MTPATLSKQVVRYPNKHVINMWALYKYFY